MEKNRIVTFNFSYLTEMTRVESELILSPTKLSSNGFSAEVTVDFEEEKVLEESIEDVMETARKAFKSGKSKPLSFRQEQLKALERFLIECEEDIVDALQKDLRKHRQEVFMGEIDPLKQDLRHILFELPCWIKPDRPEKRIINLLDGVYIYHDPYGVVLILGAWNYPFMLLLGPLFGAIAGGNCVILKPSELAPHSAETVAKLLPKYLDKECFHVVLGDVEKTTDLLKQKFDYILFTGSTNVGKIIHQAAAKSLTPTTLELGGKSPVYLDDSADIDIATRRILWGKCLNSGQTCIAPDYLLCSKEIEEKFVAKAREIIQKFYGEDAKLSPFMSSILSDRHFHRLMNFLNTSNIALGGTCDPGKRLISPTILTNVNPDDPVMQEEIFGPILPIINVNSPQEAVDFINNRDKPLAFYIFTKKKDVQQLFLNETSSGGVAINDTMMHLLTENLPFGGVGASGMGNYHGKASFDTFTHKKSVLVRGLDTFSEVSVFARYPPYSNFKTDFLSFLVKKRRGISLRWIKNATIFGLGVGLTCLVQYIVF